ncbi:MAG: peptidylprolyl isomerase [Cyclobacteriaceae bacterium]
MKIDLDTVASVTYKLKVDGELIETADKSNPLIFLVGADAMIPGFESQLLGKQPGDAYEMTILPEDGYGDVDPEAVIELSKEVFKIDGVLQEEMIQLGNSVQMKDQNGDPLLGVILEINDDTVTMDFNHELAGKTLHFVGEVIDVRTATEEEIEHGHVHGPGGHNH